MGHGKGYGLRNNQGGGRERGHGRGRARGQGCGRVRDQHVVLQGQEVVSLGVMEENNLPERSIFQYSDDLQKRCADIDDLLMELKSTEEWRSVTTHNIFRLEEVLALYLKMKQWNNLQSKILKAISVVCF